MRNVNDIKAELRVIDMLTKQNPVDFKKKLETIDIYQKVGALNRTLLHIAVASHAETEIIKILLEKLKDKINELDDNGLTPLHLAAIHGNLPVIELLMEFGADPEAKVPKDGATIFDFLKENKHSDLIPEVENLLHKRRCTILEQRRLHSLNDRLKLIQILSKQLLFSLFSDLKKTSQLKKETVEIEPILDDSTTATANIPENVFSNNHSYKFKPNVKVLDNLKKSLSENIPAAIIGSTGCGKTELVKYYAHEYIQEHSKKFNHTQLVVWMFDATTSETLLHSALTLLQQFNISTEQNEESYDEWNKRIVRCLDYHLNKKNCLLIFDNVDRYETIANYLSLASAKPQIILTSRADKFPNHVKCFTLEPMPADEAIDLLIKLANTDRNEATNSAKALHYIPMALVLAAFTIKHSKTKFASFAALFERTKSQGNNRDPITIILDIFFKYVEPEFFQLISICSSLNYKRIPYTLLKTSLKKMQNLDAVLKKLHQYGIIQIHKKVGKILLSEVDSISFNHTLLLTKFNNHIKTVKESLAKWEKDKEKWLADKEKEWLTTQEKLYKQNWGSYLFSFDIQTAKKQYNENQRTFDENNYFKNFPRPGEEKSLERSSTILSELSNELVDLLNNNTTGFSEKAALLTYHLETYFKNANSIEIDYYHNLLGCAYFILLNDTKKALVYFEKTINSSDKYEQIKGKNNKAILFLKTNKLGQAKGLLEQLLFNTKNLIGFFYELSNADASIFSNLGIIYFLVDDFQKAYKNFSSALDEIHKFRDDKLLRALLWANKGLAAYAEFNNNEAAFYGYQEALNTLKSIQADPKFITSIYLSQAILNHQAYTRKNDALALDKIESALSLLAGTVSHQHIVVLIVAADICVNLKNYEKANSYYELAKTLVEKLGGNDVLLAEIFNNQGVLYLDAKEPQRAQENFAKAMDLGEKATAQLGTKFDVIIANRNETIILKVTPTTAKLSDTTLHWHIPPKSSFSITRHELLDAINKAFATDPTCAITQESTTGLMSGLGMSGLGKTQLAIQYIQQNKEIYQNVIWFNADYIAAEFREFAQEILHENIEDLQDEAVAQLVWKQLGTLNNWLIVIDNVAYYSDIKTFFPPQDLLTSDKTKRRHLLIISDTHHWKTCVYVNKFSEEESLEYINAFFESTTLPKKEEALALCRKLGFWPIALSLAFGHIKNTNCEISDYLDVLQSLSKEDITTFCYREILHHTEEIPHPLFSKTFTVSSQKLKNSQYALMLLKFLAYLNLEYIPTFLLEELVDAKKYLSALNALQGFAIINIGAEKQISIHKLFLNTIQMALQSKHKNIWLDTPNDLIIQILKQFNYERHNINNIEKLTKFLPYIEALLKNISRWGKITSDILPTVLTVCQYYLFEEQNAQAAEPLLELGLDSAKKSSSNLIMDFYNYLGYACYLQGDYEKAQQFIFIAKSIAHYYKKPQDVNFKLKVAFAHQIMGHINLDQDNYKDAKIQYETAISFYKAVYEDKPHIDIAISYRYLGYCYYQMSLHSVESSYPAAIMCYDLALKTLDELKHDKNDQQLAMTYLNLGNVYFFQGDYDNAERQCTNALRIITESVGDTPNLILIYCTLANTAFMKKDYSKAKIYYESALSIQNKLYYNSSTNTLKIFLGLHYVNYVENNYDEALKYIKLAQEILLKHPNLDPDFAIKKMLQSKLANYKFIPVDKLQTAFLNDLLILEKSKITILLSPTLESLPKNINTSRKEEKKTTTTTYSKMLNQLSNTLTLSKELLNSSKELRKSQEESKKKLDEEQRKIQQNYADFLQSAKPPPEKTSHKDKTKEFIKSLDTLDLSTAESSDEESKSDKEEAEETSTLSP